MHFIGAEITVDLPDTPALEKKPPPPRAFTWNDAIFEVVELLAEWHRYGRPEIRTQGSRPPYAQRSGRTQGSWGVGRAYYRVRTADGRLFDIYYDRAPKKQQRSGSWFLWRELEEGDDLTVEE
ncbi:MAG: hypothetical protein KDD84_02160 [Caldilineaceae bacterium]|nr:hypothetical protein [Caldilineaceae bacterium]